VCRAAAHDGEKLATARERLNVESRS